MVLLVGLAAGWCWVLLVLLVLLAGVVGALVLWWLWWVVLRVLLGGLAVVGVSRTRTHTHRKRFLFGLRFLLRERAARDSKHANRAALPRIFGRRVTEVDRSSVRGIRTKAANLLCHSLYSAASSA